MWLNDEEVNTDVKLKQLQHNLIGEKEREREIKTRTEKGCYASLAHIIMISSCVPSCRMPYKRRSKKLTPPRIYTH